MTKTSIIIPATDEIENLPDVLSELCASGLDIEIIVVTLTIAEAIEVDRLGFHASVYTQTRTGKGNALAVGFSKARGEQIVMMDGDGSHRVEDVHAMIAALDEGYEFVKASRFLPGGNSEDFTPIRRFGAWVLTWMFNVLFGTKHTDLCYGLMAFHVDMLSALGLPDVQGHDTQDGDGFEIETLLNCRMARIEAATIEVPSVEMARHFGTSHLRPFRDGLRILRTLLAERRQPHMFLRSVRKAA